MMQIENIEFDTHAITVTAAGQFVAGYGFGFDAAPERARTIVIGWDYLVTVHERVEDGAGMGLAHEYHSGPYGAERRHFISGQVHAHGRNGRGPGVAEVIQQARLMAEQGAADPELADAMVAKLREMGYEGEL